MCNNDEAHDAITNYALVAKVRMETWLSFAPRYTALYPWVTQKLHGWMSVCADHAMIYLPKQEDDTRAEDQVLELEFGFSEVQLKKCTDFLTEYEKAETAAAKWNSGCLERLKNMFPWKKKGEETDTETKK